MALMLVDHVREFFFLHQQLGDPMNLDATSPSLFFTRLASHFCAPVFIFLSGVSAWCYGQKFDHPRGYTARYLASRGMFLVLIELTVVNTAWYFPKPPPMVYLQVIWAIGLSMLALACLLWLPATLRIILGLGIVFGHNLLDGIHFLPQEGAFAVWAVLHERTVIELASGLRLRTSYPILPWVGVILLGYAVGPLYARTVQAAQRRLLLFLIGGGGLLTFVFVRWLNGYGDTPRLIQGDGLGLVLSWFNVTKYPPSLAFLLLTLGVGLLALALLEKAGADNWLAQFGRVPLFFYLLHLYALAALRVLLSPDGQTVLVYSWQIWGVSGGMLVALYLPCRVFADYKRRSRSAWLGYL